MDKDCKFRGKFEFHTKAAVGRPIKLEEFKLIAKKYQATVNELFQAISLGSLKRYAVKYQCQVFNDDKFDGVYTAVGIVNRRPLSPVGFAKDLVKYASYGTNSNAIDFTPYYVNVKNAGVVEAQKSFSSIKYGYRPKVFRILSESMWNIPGGTRMLFEQLAKCVTIVTSNFQGPANLIPLPSKEYVSWMFGMAVPAMLPLNFTLMTYNKHIRIGILVDNGSIEDPNLLLECFVEEWDSYNR